MIANNNQFYVFTSGDPIVPLPNASCACCPGSINKYLPCPATATASLQEVLSVYSSASDAAVNTDFYQPLPPIVRPGP